MSSARSLIVAVAVPLLLAATHPALAHALKVFAAAVGEHIEGRVYFAGGGGAREVTVRVTTADGRNLATTTTDADGRFAFAARERIDHVITADSGDGHIARVTIAATSLPSALPSPSVKDAAAASPADATRSALAVTTTPSPDLDERIARSVAAQIVPLREQLDGYEQQMRLRDILGGLGYILGLAGLALWLKARQRGETGR